MTDASPGVPAAPGLNRWADEKPEPGRHFILYEPWDDEPILVEHIAREGDESFFAVMQNGLRQEGDCAFYTDIDDPPSGRAQWCYVPKPPDWSADYKDGEEIWNA